GATLEVSLGRLDAGIFTPEVTRTRTQAWDQRVGFNPSGADGALEFDAAWADWSIPFDTSDIRGSRELRARLLDATGREVAEASRTVQLTDAAPSDVELLSVPPKVWRMRPLAVRARGRDRVVGIKEVRFFLGKPAAGNKVPENVASVLGVQ